MSAANYYAGNACANIILETAKMTDIKPARAIICLEGGISFSLILFWMALHSN